MSALFTIGLECTRIHAPAAAVGHQFEQDRGIVCPSAIEPDLLSRLMLRCDAAAWRAEDLGAQVGGVQFEFPARVGPAIGLMLQRQELLSWLEDATGTGPLKLVTGRVFRIEAGTDNRLEWHDDRNDPRRRLAVTIDLSPDPFEGGTFELRDVRTQDIVLRHHHRLPGNALIFEVSPRSEHRVLRVVSGGPRRMFGGWFCTAAATREFNSPELD